MEKTDFITGLLVLFFSYFTISFLKDEERPVVLTENGEVRGVYGFATGRKGKYAAFKGIPYALAPVRELRFEPPQLPRNWSNIRDAGYYRSQCISVDVLATGLMLGSEDCLFLNVFVPITQYSSPLPLPVMVFFHGGYWHEGSLQDHGEKRFMGEDIILITVNYRLGGLGFLSTGDEVILGNMGLKDQNMALKWVKRNIGNFGGDFSRITIFGESVGGVSVHYHLLSKASKGLFHRAISQSGTVFSPFASYSQVKAQSRRYAAKFNCSSSNSTEMIQCLKKVDVTTFVSVHVEANDLFRRREMVFSPTVEVINDSQAFIVEDPVKTFLRGDYSKVPWILGVLDDKGMILSSDISLNETKRHIIQDWMTGLPSLLQYVKNDEVTSRIKNYYFSNSTLNLKDYFISNLTDLFSDYVFLHGTSRSAKVHSNHAAETYLYYFNYRSFLSSNHFMIDKEASYVLHIVSLVINGLWRFFQAFILGWPTIPRRSGHGEETGLLLTHGPIPSTFYMLPQRDSEVSNKMVQLWTAFAKSWDTLTFGKVTWNPLKPNRTLRYLEISSKPRMIDEPFQERIKFWDSIYDSIERE